jgi:hypothetical protein
MPIQARGRFHRNTAVAGRRWRGAGPAQGGLNARSSQPILRAWPRSRPPRRSRLGGARGRRLRQSQAAALGQPHRSLFYLFALFPSARAPLRTTLYAGSTLHARPKGKRGLIYRTGFLRRGTTEAHRSPRCSGKICSSAKQFATYKVQRYFLSTRVGEEIGSATHRQFCRATCCRISRWSGRPADHQGRERKQLQGHYPTRPKLSGCQGRSA